MKVNIRRIYNDSHKETGAILSAIIPTPTNLQQKIAIENQLIQYGFDHLYPNEGLNIFRDMYVDTPSVTIIKKINNIAYKEINI